MININIFKNQRGIYGFEIIGHAGFNPGNDIVCAAISTIAQVIVMGLEHYSSPSVEIRDGYLICELAEVTDISQALLHTAYEGFKAIEAEYGNYVRVRG